jgi:transcriptional regulator with XRE-family HTH domain
MDAAARRTAALLRSARTRAGLSLRGAATRALTSHPALAAYESGRKSPTIATLLRILESYGFAADIELSPRIRERDGVPRGEELEAALALAESFPARPSATLAFPRLGPR